MNDPAEELCRVGRSLFERGYVHGTAGNISLHLPDGSFLITPTDACLGTLDPARLAHVDASGKRLGGGTPSKTLALHRRIYAAEPDARCVLHTHSRALVQVTLSGAWRADDLLPPITPYFVMKVGHVPCVPYHSPGDPAVADIVVDRIAASQAAARTLRAVMLERLGPVVWHRDPAQAMATLEEMEETAALWLRCGRSVERLSEAQIDELRHRFGASW